MIAASVIRDLHTLLPASAVLSVREDVAPYASDGLVLTNNPFAVVDNPDIDIVVEMVGGISPAKDLILMATDNGEHVVTANKALIANHGTEIFAATQKKGVMVAF